jgi:hypothetical protein
MLSSEVTTEMAPVSICLRQGDVGFNDPKAEKQFGCREEQGWPIARTRYTKYYLDSDGGLSLEKKPSQEVCKVPYKALGSLQKQYTVQFSTKPFEETTEFIAHVTAHLNISRELCHRPSS